MNWLHFLGSVAGLYLLYYTALILIDLLLSRNTKVPAHGELTFSEHIIPQKLQHVLEAELQNKTKEGSTGTGIKTPREPAVIASGGVSLKNLFGLCREEAIIYTRSVSF